MKLEYGGDFDSEWMSVLALLEKVFSEVLSSVSVVGFVLLGCGC